MDNLEIRMIKMVVGKTNILARLVQCWISRVHKRRVGTSSKFHGTGFKFHNMVIVACMIGNLE